MAVLSLGYRTDLRLLKLQGGMIEQRAGYQVVRTPANPTFHWGNFLLLPAPPAAGTVSSWLRAFHREFPDTDHLALGVDGTTGVAGDPAELATAGLDVDRTTVMTAGTVHPPPRPNREARFRMLVGDEDWHAALALQEATSVLPDVEGFRTFARHKLAATRRLQERGGGGWFGAFVGGDMVAGLGMFTAGFGIARFQSVDTCPAYRNQGLAGTLVYTAGLYATRNLGAQTLVMVADPTYPAIRVYRSVGFTSTETQVRLQRRT